MHGLYTYVQVELHDKQGYGKIFQYYQQQEATVPTSRIKGNGGKHYQ